MRLPDPTVVCPPCMAEIDQSRQAVRPCAAGGRKTYVFTQLGVEGGGTRLCATGSATGRTAASAIPGARSSAASSCASWGAWHWLSQAPVRWWRLAAALGIVVVAVATVWDLYWHQTHPMEVRASMAGLPPHQAILAGFLIGLVGAAFGVAATTKRSRQPRALGRSEQLVIGLANRARPFVSKESGPVASKISRGPCGVAEALAGLPLIWVHGMIRPDDIESPEPIHSRDEVEWSLLHSES